MPRPCWPTRKQNFSPITEWWAFLQQIPDGVVEPLVKMVMSAPADKMMIISDVFDYKWPEEKHSFDGFVCEECGEMVVEQYGRIKGDKKVSMDCLVK